jgi:hypothetical protein
LIVDNTIPLGANTMVLAMPTQSIDQILKTQFFIKMGTGEIGTGVPLANWSFVTT